MDKSYNDDIRPLLDLNDSLPALLQGKIDFPIIASCGMQSHGKSSTLESITHISLPQGQGTVTVCPIKISLRNARDEEFARIKFELDKNDKYEKIDFFCYESLRKRFRRNLLDLLEKELGPSFKEIKKQCYSKKYENGFYVYAKKNEFKSLKAGVEYVTRYCGRPPISENRIINYDGKNVTFSYNAHEDGKYHEKTVPVEEFIMLLVNHIIPSNFKTIRYYGFYRKKPSIHEEISKMIKKEWIQFRRTCLKYKMSILKCFNRDPYRCPKCNTKMNFLVLLN